MKLSGDARWLLGYIAESSQGVAGNLLEAGARAKALQWLIDSKLILFDEKGRYWLTTDGQRMAQEGAA